jgi:hypothetical protein
LFIVAHEHDHGCWREDEKCFHKRFLVANKNSGERWPGAFKGYEKRGQKLKIKSQTQKNYLLVR